MRRGVFDSEEGGGLHIQVVVFVKHVDDCLRYRGGDAKAEAIRKSNFVVKGVIDGKRWLTHSQNSQSTQDDHPKTAYLNPIAAFRAPQPPCPSSPTNPLSDSLFAETPS
jgi:hypothetical protein